MNAKRRGTAELWLEQLFSTPPVNDTDACAALEVFEDGESSRAALERSFRSLLVTTRQQLAAARRESELKRLELVTEENTTRSQCRAELVQFLVSARVVPLNELSRQVLRERRGVLEKLGWSISEVNSMILAEFAGERAGR